MGEFCTHCGGLGLWYYGGTLNIKVFLAIFSGKLQFSSV